MNTSKNTNRSEYIRDLIRCDQAQLLEIETIRSELMKGEKKRQTCFI